jgi:hypothetical protein
MWASEIPVITAMLCCQSHLSTMVFFTFVIPFMPATLVSAMPEVPNSFGVRHDFGASYALRNRHAFNILHEQGRCACFAAMPGISVRVVVSFFVADCFSFSGNLFFSSRMQGKIMATCPSK